MRENNNINKIIESYRLSNTSLAKVPDLMGFKLVFLQQLLQFSIKGTNGATIECRGPSTTNRANCFWASDGQSWVAFDKVCEPIFPCHSSYYIKIC